MKGWMSEVQTLTPLYIIQYL